MTDLPLTDTQKKGLELIINFIEENGVHPTLHELKDLMKYKAIGTAQWLVKSLRQKGYIRVYKKTISRSLVPTKKDF